jgi:hypothetical protein
VDKWRFLMNAVPYSRGKTDGLYCSLVESNETKGVFSHSTHISLSHVELKRLPYLMGAINSRNFENIFGNSKNSH